MKKFTAISLALLMLLSLCACGAKSEYAAAPQAAPAAAYSASYDMAATEEAAYYDNGSGFASGAMPAEEPAAEPTEMEGGSEPDSAAADIDPDKIIYSANATVETTDFDGTVKGVNDLVKAHGGFIESSSVNGTNYYNKSRGYQSSRSASFTIRIPSADFNTVMNSLSTLGNVPYTYTFSENISSRYYDTQARLNAYKTQEQSLLKMMELAETVEDVIAIEDKLSDIRYNIESLQTRLNGWDRQVNFSTIDLEVQEVREYTPETVEQPGYGKQLWLSLKDGLEGVAEFFKDFLVWFVGALPALIVLAVLFFVFRPLLRKANDKRKARREAKKAEKAAK